MNCPYCKLNIHYELRRTTALGYKQHYCRHCDKQYNARTGTVFNFIQYRTEVVMLAVHYYYRFKNSLDGVVELMAIRGIHLSHQTVHNWVQNDVGSFSLEFKI
jgi:transposase-like protein